MTSVPTNTILVGDCLELLPQLPPACIDAVITDPPYGISNEVRITRGRNKMKFKGPDISHKFGDWDVFASERDFWEFTAAWVSECDRVLKPGGTFISYFDRDRINFLSALLKEEGYKLRNYYADCKLNPVPQARKVNWQSGWEMAGIWQKPGDNTYNYERGQHKDWGTRPIVAGNERTAHPTQKPFSLALDFVRWWVREFGTVLDPFCGSGTNLLAARHLCCDYIGIEISEEYAELARQRIEREGTPLFTRHIEDAGGFSGQPSAASDQQEKEPE